MTTKKTAAKKIIKQKNKKIGRPPKGKETTVADCKKALEKYDGFISLAAESLGMVQSALTQRIEKTQELKDFLDSMRNKVLLEVENLFMDNVRSGDKTCQIFFLKCQGKDRGWIEKQEIDIGFQRVVKREIKRFDGDE